MSRITVMVEVDAASVGPLIEALGATGLAQSISVMNVAVDGAPVPGAVIAGQPGNGGVHANGVAWAASLPAVAPGTPDRVAAPAVRRTVRRVGAGRASKVLMPAPRMTADRVEAMVKKGDFKPTPIEAKVLAVVMKHAKRGGVTEAGVTKETGANYHSVSGAVFSLRGAKGTKPAIIASVPIPTK